MKNKIIKLQIATLISLPLFLFSFTSVFAETMIMSFTVEGSSGYVSKVANYMTFKWESKNTSYCSASASNHYNWSGNKGTNGTEQIFVGWPGSITYKLTCFNSEGKSISKSVGVTIPATITTAKKTTVSSVGNTSLSNTNTSTVTSTIKSCNFSKVTNFKDLVSTIINCFLTPIVYLIVSLSVLLFVWGVFRFIRSDGEEEKTRGKEFMLWGIIGLFVMISIWGIVAILQSTFTFS